MFLFVSGSGSGNSSIVDVIYRAAIFVLTNTCFKQRVISGTDVSAQ